MSDLLRRAFEKAAELPERAQDEAARRLLELLEDADEREWDETFARSGEQLDRLAEQAREHHRAGRAKPLDPEKL